MLPQETPLEPVPSSLLPHCLWKWPHQPHLARDPPQAAIGGERRESKLFFPRLPPSREHLDENICP